MTEGKRTSTDQYGNVRTTYHPRPCAAQWTYDGVTYRGCAYATGAHKPWCATQVTPNGQYVSGKGDSCKMRWDGGYCDLDVNECTTDGNEGQQLRKCLFPWTYKGVTYDGCANPDSSPKLWCPTKLDGNGNFMENFWGYCKMRNENGFCDRHGAGEFLPNYRFNYKS